MKHDPQCRQADLFGSADPSAPALAPEQRTELIDLLSRLLWQVASAQVADHREGSDEQDRP